MLLNIDDGLVLPIDILDSRALNALVNIDDGLVLPIDILDSRALNTLVY